LVVIARAKNVKYKFRCPRDARFRSNVFAVEK